MGTKVKCGMCGDEIESKHQHDFVWCSCGETFVDGGDAYLRCGGQALLKDENGNWEDPFLPPPETPLK